MRILSGILVALLAAWQSLCFVDSLILAERGGARFREVTWPATWRMFTHKVTSNGAHAFEGRYDGVWVRLPMEEWYPARWDQSYRWEDAAGKARRLEVWVEAACERSGADEVRYTRRYDKRTIGNAHQPIRDVEPTIDTSRRCR